MWIFSGFMIVQLIVLVLIQMKESTGNEWNYLDQSEWSGINPLCGNGETQSPINIERKETIRMPNMSYIKFLGYNRKRSWNMTFNGHTIVVTPLDNYISIQARDITRNLFNLVQFHLHWGESIVDNEGNLLFAGSENHIDGVQAPIEMHLVHKDSEGRLLVISYLFKMIDDKDFTLEPIIDSLDELDGTNTVTIEFDLWKMLKLNRNLARQFYRFNGSLTTPPCTQPVIWNVMNQQVPISADELKVLSDKFPGNFYREIQPLNNRPVYFKP